MSASTMLAGCVKGSVGLDGIWLGVDLFYVEGHLGVEWAGWVVSWKAKFISEVLECI